MKNIKLQYFQGHDNTTIELADTITAITGKTDHGKSSIIRAIEFVKDNRPSGNKIIKNGASSTSVTIDNVTHKKSKSTDQYSIEGHKDPYKALRGSVPEEVTTELNLGPENIQKQLDSIFLLNESSGKVAQKLSDLSDLDVTVSALQFISAKKRSIKTEMDAIIKSIEVTEEQLHKLKHTDSVDSDLVILEAEMARISNLVSKHDNIHEKYKNAVKALSELNSIPSDAALQPAKGIIQQYDEIAAEEKHLVAINKVVSKIKSLEEKLKCDPTQLLKRSIRVEKALVNNLNIEKTIEKANRIQVSLNGIKEDIEEKEERKNELMGDTCPLCGK